MGCPDCEELVRYVSEYVDAILDDFAGTGSQDRIHRHVCACPHCEELAASERKLRLLLQDKCVQAAPASLRVRIEEAIIISRRPAAGGGRANCQ